MVWVVSRFRLKAPLGISSSCISPLASSEQRSRASWASQPQKSATLSPQPGGKPRKFIRTCGGIGGGWGEYIYIYLERTWRTVQSSGNKLPTWSSCDRLTFARADSVYTHSDLIPIGVITSDTCKCSNELFWTKSSRCVLILYIHFIIYIYIYFSQHNYIIKA